MFARLLFLFLAVPLVELILLLLLKEATNWIFTLLLVIATGVLGAYLAKQQGLAAWRAIRADLAEGRPPAASVLDAALVLVASALLLTPGVLTDAVGLSLLFPPTRRRYRRWLLQWLRSRFRTETFPRGPAGRSSVVIDSYVVKDASQKTTDEDP